ncbi:magnesium transporter MgtE N-terminal domain-containing protein [Numidum massiliense]|uniref:magnesium transporter MgtE N-terminal domain-containing protein n=1 Tax=Numidum massiliense TaxID=1522315 RepID=UPI0006D58FAD|nr:hypothetical protein [Numidum massiliense]
MIKLYKYKFREEYTYFMIRALKVGQREQFRRDFLNLHPADQLAFFLELDGEKRYRVYNFLKPTELADMFRKLEPAQRRHYVTEWKGDAMPQK